MIKRSGYADLPLHGGTVPKWLSDRMMVLGTQIIESIFLNYGKKEVLVRLSDPLWFQSFGCVLGMDWHSSGITTSVMYALKRGINRRAHELGLCVCGGRGKYSRRTPDEIKFLADATGMDGDSLIKSSRLTAKVDSALVQDGFTLYQHNFVLSDEGDWTVIQQGMNTSSKTARRYHWTSENLRSFIEEPHSGVTGENKGEILNLTDSNAEPTRSKILLLAKENPERIINEVKKIKQSEPKVFSAESEEILFNNDRNLVMPQRHNIIASDINLKRLGAVLTTSYESGTENFESLVLTPGLGARTLQSLTLISEVIYGTPSRFKDPARFSMAHGGKDGHPFPVPVKIYDESIRILGDSIEKSKMNYTEKSECIKRLHKTALFVEENCMPEADFEKFIEHEKLHSAEWDGRQV